jgi:hypothetical protein
MSYTYTDYKGLWVITPTPTGQPALLIDTNFKRLADGLSTAKTVYVAKNGNDTTGNGSLYKPLLTVQAALNRVATGDAEAVFVGPGRYEEDAVMTATANTPAGWLLAGSGKQGTVIRSIKIVAAASIVMNIDLQNFCSDDSSSAPALELQTSSNAIVANIDVSNVYLDSGSGSGTLPLVKISGSPPSGEPAIINFTGACAIKARGSGQNAVQLDHGRFYMYNGSVVSASGSEVVANPAATCVSLVACGLGEGTVSNLGKSAPCISVPGSGSGLQVILLGAIAFIGTGHLIDAAAGAQIAVIADQIVAVRGGTGGLSCPAGQAVVGDTMDFSTGQELPVTAGLLVYTKKAGSTVFTPTVAGNWTTSPTTVQAALDELASRLHAAEH